MTAVRPATGAREVGARPAAASFDELFDGLQDGYARAAAASGEHPRCYDIAGQRIEVRFAGSVLAEAFGSALSHLELAPPADRQPEPGHRPDLLIRVWDSASSGVRPPHPDWAAAPMGRKGVLHGLQRPGGRAGYIWGVGAAQVYAEERREAVYWAEDQAAIPYWERSFPFRQLLTWHFRDVSLQPMHAACVARDGRGVLLPGISGSGKSTTTVQLALAGYDLLGDDYVLLDTRAEPKVWSLYRTVKLDDCSVARFPAIARDARRLRPDDEKAVLLWGEDGHRPLRRRTGLSAIVIPKLALDAPTALGPAPAGDVVFALAPTTVNHLDVDPAKVFRMSREAALAAPAYRLAIGRDSENIPEIIGHVLAC